MALLNQNRRSRSRDTGRTRSPREANRRSPTAIKVAFIARKPANTGKNFAATQILVVPSRWREPFGIVALEGIACGCVAVGSAEGGLTEAIGSCGLTFPNGDGPALASVLARLLDDPAECDRLRANAPAHLARFTTRSVAAVYLDAMKNAAR